MVPTITVSRRRQTRHPTRPNSQNERSSALNHAVRLIHAVCGLAGSPTLIDEIRADLHRKTHKILGRLRELDIATPNESGYPIIEIPLANHEDIDEVGSYLFERGIYTTMAAYPLVPKDEVGFRIQVTAANEDDQIDELVAALGALADRFDLQPPDALSEAA